MRDLTMTPDQAAWVFEHVVLGYHDANERNWWCGPDQSDDRLICACQLPCTWCQGGRHDLCSSVKKRKQAVSVRVDDGEETPTGRSWRLGWGPETYLRAPAECRPPTRKRPLWLSVWLADRVCTYLCDCTVCAQPAAPPAPVAVPAATWSAPAAAEQLDLFGAVSV